MAKVAVKKVIQKVEKDIKRINELNSTATCKVRWENQCFVYGMEMVLRKLKRIR